MKILYVCSEYPPAIHGGIGVFTKRIAIGLVSKGVEVVVAGFDRSMTEDSWNREEGVLVHRFANPYQRRKKIKIGSFYISPHPIQERKYLSKRLEELVSHYQIDIIESFEWSGPLWEKPSVPLVIRLHGSNTINRSNEKKDKSFLINLFEKRNLKMADFIVGISKHILQRSMYEFNLEKKKKTVLYNGINIDNFKPKAGQNDDTSSSILYVGRIHEVKGIYELFAALNNVLEKYSKTIVNIVGSGNNFESVKIDLLGRITPKAQNRIHFHGSIPHERLPEFYQNASLCVVPSRSEAFGLTCVEAMACGIPVLMTMYGSGPEIIGNLSEELIIDPYNAESFADKMISLLRDSNKRKKIGMMCRGRVLEEFDEKVIIEKNIEFYQAIDLQLNGE